MIWFYLAGYISGAVGSALFIWCWFKAHVKQVSKDEMMRTLAEMEGKNDVPQDPV